MNRTARLQSLAGAVTVVALPPLYIGGVHDVPLLTGLGLATFTAGMLATPALRFVRRPTPAPTRRTRPTESDGSTRQNDPAE